MNFHRIRNLINAVEFPGVFKNSLVNFSFRGTFHRRLHFSSANFIRCKIFFVSLKQDLHLSRKEHILHESNNEKHLHSCRLLISFKMNWRDAKFVEGKKNL